MSTLDLARAQLGACTTLLALMSSDVFATLQPELQVLVDSLVLTQQQHMLAHGSEAEAWAAERNGLTSPSPPALVHLDAALSPGVAVHVTCDTRIWEGVICNRWTG